MKRRVYIIAEVGVNHNGSIQIAKRLIEEAAKAGADAVKFQTFKADKLVAQYAPKADYQKQLTDQSETQFDMIRKLELSESEHYELKDFSHHLGIDFLSTPFDEASLDFLAYRLDVAQLKISSGDLTNQPLLLKAARTGKRLIVSTGMSTLSEIEEALSVIAFGLLNEPEAKPCKVAFQHSFATKEARDALLDKVVLLHCTTEYPTPYFDVHLNKMKTMKQAFGLPTGYSDHTMGLEIPIAAVALGAEVIEKHFTLDKTLEGPDHQASIEPTELAEMVRQIRNTEQALGISLKIPAESEIKNMEPARKSIVASRDIRPGDVLDESNITIKRPGNGIPPSLYWDLLGRTSNRAYAKDELIEW